MLRRSKRIALQQRKEIIPNLPDDIVRTCLLRVPYKWHSTLKLVCRKWKEIVSDPKFYKDRMSTGTGQQLICMIQSFRGIVVLDPVTRTWEMLPQNLDFPTGNIPLFCACVCVNGKLVLIGGCYPESSRDMKAVYIFDFASAKWRRGNDMPTQRYKFACSVSSSRGFIYVAGGLLEGDKLLAAEAYNVEEDRWETVPPMAQQQRACAGVFLGEKLFVFGGEPPENAEIFYPKAGVWTTVDNMWRLQQSVLSCTVASGHLYMTTKTHMMKYNAEEKDLVVQSVLPTKFRIVAAYTAEWRGHISVTKLYAPGSRRQFCYMLNPSTDELIEFEIPRKLAAINMGAATVRSEYRLAFKRFPASLLTVYSFWIFVFLF